MTIPVVDAVPIYAAQGETTAGNDLLDPEEAGPEIFLGADDVGVDADEPATTVAATAMVTSTDNGDETEPVNIVRAGRIISTIVSADTGGETQHCSAHNTIDGGVAAASAISAPRQRNKTSSAISAPRQSIRTLSHILSCFFKIIGILVAGFFLMSIITIIIYMTMF